MNERPIAVIGQTGQVARALVRRGAERGDNVVAAGRPDVDLTAIETVGRFIDRVRPSVVVNAAAYTAVDRAESEPQAAFALNAEGPGKLAAICHALDLPLIHLSTDYVFDGLAASPYREDSPPQPMSAYGASKAAGELAVATACRRHVIVRTAWVYGLEGHNFVRTMLRLGAERDTLGIVADQTGAPTFADDIADTILTVGAALTTAAPEGAGGHQGSAGDPERYGIFHFTNGGATTWHEFAEAIFAHAAAAGGKVPAEIKAITTAEYPTPARRPPYSVLDCGRLRAVYGISPPPWRDALARAMPKILATQP